MKKIFFVRWEMLLLSMLFLTITLNIYGQEQPDIRFRAKQYFLLGEYARSAALYKKLVDTKKVKTEDLENIAACYLHINEYEQAENWYARALQQKDHSPQSSWNYAQSLKQNGKYDVAKKEFEQYKNKYGNSKQLENEIAGADSAIVWMANPQKIDIKNESAINTGTAQFSVTPWKGNKVLFAGESEAAGEKLSGMTGRAFIKVHSANKINNSLQLGEAELLSGDINSGAYHVGPVAVDPSGDVFYVTQTYPGKGTEKFYQEGLRFKKHNLELIIYTRNGDSWTSKAFPYNDVKNYSVGHATISPDGKTLYFASDMPGGLGGVDIWFSELNADGTWGKPQNLGDAVNSSGDELFPVVQGDILYYSSNGFPGMGGLDIYAVKGERTNFTGRKNLKYPINTASDDFSYVLITADGKDKKGYLSSNRAGGLGNDDIYSFTYYNAPHKIRLIGTTLNKKTENVLPEATVYLFDKNNVLITKNQSDAKGGFSFEITEDKAYNVRAEKNGYHEDLVSVQAVHATKDTTVSVVLRLEPVVAVGDKFVLEDIYYDFDKSNIRKDASLVLNRLVRTLRDNPTLKIELSSHTDSRGDDRYNDKLSQRRAQSAVDYLVEQGIDRNRLVAKGYGERRLVNRCSNGVSCSAAEHQANRRTEIEILAY